MKNYFHLKTFIYKLIFFPLAAGIGVFKGFYEGIPKKFNLPKKLLINNFFNSVGKETCRFGNAAAGASLLYYMAGSTLNFLFEDELETMGPAQKNAICGAITGVIYKSTLGLIPSCVGGILGAGLVGSLTVLTRRLNDRNLIAFEMKF